MSVYYKETPGNLASALYSVINQSLPPTEIVLVKDGLLGEELNKVIENYCTKIDYLKTIQLPENVGLGKALQIGLEHCSYEIVARMDSDDICFHNRFEVQIPRISDSSIAVIGGFLEEFEGKPGDLKRIKKTPVSATEVEKYAKWRSPVNHPTAVFRKSVIKMVGSYIDMPLFEDYYLWIRLLNKGYKIVNVPVPVLYFRVNKHMLDRRRGIAYLRNELLFLRRLKKENLVSLHSFLLLILIRIPLRLLPKQVFTGFYSLILRNKQ